jgi:hypothetical protein
VVLHGDRNIAVISHLQSIAGHTCLVPLFCSFQVLPPWLRASEHTLVQYEACRIKNKDFAARDLFKL